MSVRGYADWKPKGEAIHWVHKTNEVLEQYEDYWPLSVRQIFYRLVADHSYAKSEAAYGKLTGILSRARRAGYVPWEAIRDGGLGRTVGANYYLDQESFEKTVRSSAKNLKLDRQEGQDRRIELWCEAGGMVPILQGIAGPYTARVNTGGGYDSVTAKHNLARRVAQNAELGTKTLILHVGDFDGSGEDMCNVLREDAGAMAFHNVVQMLRDADELDHLVDQSARTALEAYIKDNEDRESLRDVQRWADAQFEVKRVALTAEQVVDRGVETAPPKKTDSRSAEFERRNAWVADELGTENITAQLEALTPPELNTLIAESIEAELDMEIYRGVLAEEEQVRKDLLTRLDRD